ncbi:rsbT co-antagonist protein RsbR [Nannocystis exedens]|uniref:RsbT co-antagonist protein RsbR n=1 Tax=Nannocystis exedens TaxID=54 RepID=A0A1I1XUS7_9BACT|nr:STAS domain-containing protein [Nannocystis exedens]PCC73278.1 anti-anti sigma factor protein [Nannocystis exedens]SFE09300.1 rsbT co-antagonist protein RsbR [Nannocystis exedens]
MGADDRSHEELVRELEALRRQVEALKTAARRYHAMVDNPALSVQVCDAKGRVVEVNQGFERLWKLTIDVVRDHVILDDLQLEPSGSLAGVRRAYATGEATRLPAIRYDPRHTEGVAQGSAGWVASSIYPVKDEAGELVEAVVMHYEIGELARSEEELRAQNEALEVAVAERTAELSAHLRLLREQQQSIRELSTPVIRLWDGILALPLIGMIDAERAAQIMENLLAAIVAQRAAQAIIDVTGVPVIDTDVASHLFQTVRAAGLLGVHCIMVGISPKMAQTLVELDVDFSRVTTAPSLQEGLRQALTRRSDARVRVTRGR